MKIKMIADSKIEIFFSSDMSKERSISLQPLLYFVLISIKIVTSLREIFFSSTLSERNGKTS